MVTRVLVLLAVTMLAVHLAGCGAPTVVLWTDSAEVAPAVEMFNADQDDYVIEIVHQDDVSRALRLAETSGDVVIAASIEDNATARLFHSLDRVMGERIRSDDFYGALLANGVRSGRQLLLPVSFNLPLIYFSGALSREGIVISPADMRETGRAFTTIEDGQATRLAYSPLWNRRFLYEMVRFGGLAVREGDDGAPEWPLDALLAGINVSREWVREDNGGYEADAAFQEKYLYNPAMRLVRDGRVLYGYDTSDSFFRRSDLARRDLQFRWLGEDGRVPVLEGVVYAGIPARARNRSGAEAFLGWLFAPDTQRRLLENNERKRIDSFGLLGGFSSLWRVTERFMPRSYPALEFVVPPAPWLQFPPPAPRHWDAVVPEVVQPWLLREVAGVSQSRDLSSSVRAWLLQQEE